MAMRSSVQNGQKRIREGVEFHEGDRVGDGSNILDIQHSIRASSERAGTGVVTTNGCSYVTINAAVNVKVRQISLIPYAIRTNEQGNRVDLQLRTAYSIVPGTRQRKLSCQH